MAGGSNDNHLAHVQMAPGPDKTVAIKDGVAIDAQGNPVQVLPAQNFPVSHVQREKENSDKEARLIQGRMWLISFTDLFSILLCFFILMYSMKEPDFEKIAKVMGSNGGGYAGAGAGEQRGDQAGASMAQVAFGAGLDLSYLESVVQKALQQAEVKDDVKLVTARDHLKLIVKDTDGDRGTFIARRLGERLTLLPNRITVVGLPSSWSSGDWPGSMATATSFATNMKDGGYRKGLTVVGAGEGDGPGVEIRVEGDDGRAQ
ncbi:MAG TPA: flagellar motor protein MotB [Alphaproteobacteria bacterium]